MNILVTGATGFIGRNLVKKLLEDNHSLFCTLMEGQTNPFGEDKVKSLVIYPNQIETHIEYFKSNNISGIVHLASLVISGDAKNEDVADLIDSNVKFGTILLEIAVKSGIKWFLNTGTYWQNYNNQTYSPVNLYAATKQAFEDIARYYYEANEILFCTLRLFDTYGANDSRNKIFNLWGKIAKTGETLEMSPGNQIMDFSYIDDVIDAYLLIIEHLKQKSSEVKSGDIFYLQSPQRYSLKDLSLIFENVTSSKLNINWGGKPYKTREVMIPITSDKMIPGFKHKISIEEGIKRLLNLPK